MSVFVCVCASVSADRLRSVRVLDAKPDPQADDSSVAQVIVDRKLPEKLCEAAPGGRQLLLSELSVESAAV